MNSSSLETLLDRLTAGIVLTMLVALALLALISIVWVALGGSGDRIG